MRNLGEVIREDTIQHLIEEADHDGDGKINREDFYLTMKATG